MDDKTLCWACQMDISEEVQNEIGGQQFCDGCSDQVWDFVRALRKNALND
jgi:hypothetical protein